jgi:hypothetical protein
MLADLYHLLSIEKITVTVVDVDDDPALIAQFDELVPVLIGHNTDGSVTRLCHYYLDSDNVRSFCDRTASLKEDSIYPDSP